MIDFPREPNPGEDLDASWGARVVRTLRALFPMPGPGVRTSTGPTGTTISVVPDAETGGSTTSDGAVIGIVNRNSSSDSNSGATGTEVNENQLTVTLYPNWPNTTGSRTARLYTPCVYRRAPLMVGDPILCHPCAVAVTTEGEDT